MRKAVVLKHVEFEGPSRIATLLAERECSIDTRSLYRGDPVPTRLSQDQLLIVMGGPMGVADLESPQFPFLKRELELIHSCIAMGSPVLGVCLGSQLLAHAAGASVYEMKNGTQRQYEVGWGPVRFQHATGEAVLSGVPNEATLLHWHGDTFDLPNGAQLLASTDICKHQAFRLGQRSFGLQFHCETTGEDVETWLTADDGFITAANGEGAADRIRTDTARFSAEQRTVGDALLKNVIKAMLST
ncbi:MAG: gamma-glutamyl-gamma-aminobutyrate hydrolase family protein [Polyangiaceae bacterium]